MYHVCVVIVENVLILSEIIFTCDSLFVFAGEEVAIKLESVNSKHPQVMRESKIYRSLNGIGQYYLL